MDGNFWGLVVAAVLTAIFGLIIAGQNAKLAKKLQTNHGKTPGQHIEEGALAAQQALANSQLVALQLEQYKAEQAEADRRQHDLIQQYVDTDAQAHVELRSLIMQVALEKKPPGASGDAPET